MATDNALVLITLKAGSDLSSDQYKFVALATDGQIDVVASAGAVGIGVLQDDPSAAGRAAIVAVGGITKCQYGGTIDEGEKVQSLSTGLADVAASGDHVLGVAITAGVTGDVGEVLLVSQHILA